MSTTASSFYSDPIAIPTNSTNNNDEQLYKDMIKRLVTQTPEPYGAIPPLLKKKKKKKKKDKKRKLPIRRMSHVENWVAVDSKESIPDDDDLRHSSPFRNFLSTDFLVLPLHMPPPSLSATPIPISLSPPTLIKKKSLSTAAATHNSDLRPILFPIKESPIEILQLDDQEENEDETGATSGYDYEEEEDEDEEDEEDEEDDDYEDDSKSISSTRPIPSFSTSQQPSTSTTKSLAMSVSPPPSSSSSERTKSRWLETISQLRKSLTRSSLKEQVLENKKKDFIPMPSPPPLKRSKRRSEATTQPRFNTATNTYTRDTRSNSDHLRMISAELNMMRSRKLSNPLKPRGFLPKRTDSFIRGDQRKLSLLHNEIISLN